MTDHQQLFSSIHTFLDRGDSRYTEDLRTLARDFAELCRNTDNRLSRCEDFLRQGLLAEVVHQAELEPRLLPLLAELEFPRRPEWDQLVSSHSLATGARIPYQRGLSLQQAYAQHQPLAPLLKEYRRLNLSQAPIMDRLDVARQLAALDPLGEHWQDDIRELENAVHEDLAIVVARAQQRGNIDDIIKLVRQIETIPWTNPPAPEMLDGLRTKVAGELAGRAKKRLPSIIRGLKHAMDHEDLQTARRLHDEMATELQYGQIPQEDRLWQQLHRATEWLNDREQRLQEKPYVEQAQQHLRSLLSRSNSKLQEVQNAYRALAAFKEPIPGQLEKLYTEFKRQYKEKKAAERDEFEQMGNRWLLMMAIPMLLGVAGVLVWILMRAVRP